MTRPLLLDLFCCEGGAAMGYHRAGFDVIGIDIEPQPNYPFEFIQGDALDVNFARHFAAIHASPPCQAFSLASLYHGKNNQDKHPDLVDATRSLLESSGLPWVVENVTGSPLRPDLVLCGEMFGLRVHRHRVFESNVLLMRPQHQPHKLKGAQHNCHIEDGHTRIVAGNYADHADASDAMGIDWMTRKGLSQAIPPAYTEYIGTQLLQHLGERVA